MTIFTVHITWQGQRWQWMKNRLYRTEEQLVFSSTVNSSVTRKLLSCSGGCSLQATSTVCSSSLRLGGYFFSSVGTWNKIQESSQPYTYIQLWIWWQRELSGDVLVSSTPRSPCFPQEQHSVPSSNRLQFTVHKSFPGKAYLIFAGGGRNNYTTKKKVSRTFHLSTKKVLCTTHTESLGPCPAPPTKTIM